MIQASERVTCFYCRAVVRANAEYDHFPIPRSAGGSILVPACISCHDMKDRTRPRDWPDEWVAKTIEDFPKFSRETRLFLAVAMRLYADTLGNVPERRTRKSARAVSKVASGSRRHRSAPI